MSKPVAISLRATTAASTVTWLVLGTAAFGAATPVAEGDDVEVANTETVQVYTDATGNVDTQRVYEQLVFTGNGEVTVENPVSTAGLRNLDGFSGYDVEGGSQIISTEVDGQERVRSVSDFEGELPLEVTVSYLLDGEEVEPGDVIGEEGDLEVKYHVENVTGETETLQLRDGIGGFVTKDVEVVLPMVGSLSTVVPPNFTDVESDQANMAGDGRGGTKLSFTMTLFPPIGAPTADFGYTAKISDGMIPDASISALPLEPLESASFKVAGQSYKGGSETGAELTAGVTEIDTNLLELRDGAAELSAGLLKLYAGASRLSAGLNEEAVPGAEKLADGSTELSDGATRLFVGSGELVEGMTHLQDGSSRLVDGADQLDRGGARLREGANDLNDGAVRLRDGANDLDDGAVQLRDGANDLNVGAIELDNGAVRVDDGANELSNGLLEAGEKAPALIDGLKQVRAGLVLVDGGLTRMYGETQGARAQFRAGLDEMIAGIGSAGDPKTLLGGLTAIRAGLSGAKVKLDEAVDQQLPCGIALLNELATGQPAPVPCREGVPIGPGQVTNAIPQVQAVQQAYLAAIRDKTTTLRTGLVQLRDQLALQVLPGLTKVMCGLDNTVDPNCVAARPGILQGVDGIDEGITRLIDGIQGGIGQPSDTAADQTLRGGLNGLQAGTGELIGGGTALLRGLTRLTIGAGDLSEGTGHLVDGTGRVVEGSQRLADGSILLADGTRQLADGTIVLADGSQRLTDGTVVLANGTKQLADGADELDDGSAQLYDGSVRLQDGADRLASGGDQLEAGLLQLYGGLVDAADGSNRLRGGLQQAADGAPRIEDGATKLSKQGTSKLVDAGSDTTLEFGEKYAVLQAGTERAQTESMAFGAPDNAQGLTAYTYEIRGEDGEGGRSWGRGLAALVVFAAGTGFLMWRRRLV